MCVLTRSGWQLGWRGIKKVLCRQSRSGKKSYFTPGVVVASFKDCKADQLFQLFPSVCPAAPLRGSLDFCRKTVCGKNVSHQTVAELRVIGGQTPVLEG